MLLKKIAFSYKSEMEKILCVNSLDWFGGFFTKINISIFDLGFFENPSKFLRKQTKIFMFTHYFS